MTPCTTYPICFVSLGPGDPELVTLKGLKALQQADLIFCPATQSREGKIFSRSAYIVMELGISEKHIQTYLLPMKRVREAALTVYDNLCQTAFQAWSEGKRIVVVAEGDAGFYSSTQYLYEQLVEQGASVERTAGVPAFIAAGARAGLHIVKQEERLMVIPGTITADELAGHLEAGYVVVIMKLSACAETIRQLMSTTSGYRYHYFENLGSEQEYYTSSPAEIATRTIPYFSLMIIQKDNTF